MGFRLNTGSYSAWADKNAKPFGGYSSVEENFAASVGQVVDEELSISSIIWDNNSDERNRQILDLVDEGKVDNETVQLFTSGNLGRGRRTDYNALAEYLNENGLLSEHIDTDEELDKIVTDELALRRSYRNQVFDTALTGGKVAQFAGGFIASGLDPVNMVAMGLAAPVAGVRATSKAMYALSMAGRSAALNVAVAVPIEPIIHAWKEKIGAEYTVTDSLFNIGISGILGGTVSGVAAAIGKRFTGDSILNKDYDSLITHFKKAGLEPDDAETMARFVDETNQAFDKNMSAKDFVRNAEATQERMNEGPKGDSESEIDIDDMETLDAMYAEVPEDFTIKLEDDSEISVRELDMELEADVQFLKDKLGCLSGK